MRDREARVGRRWKPAARWSSSHGGLITAAAEHLRLTKRTEKRQNERQQKHFSEMGGHGTKFNDGPLLTRYNTP